MVLWRVVAGLLVLVGLPLVAQADEGWTPGVDIAGGLLHTQMHELIDGHAQVTESGFLPDDEGRLFLRHGKFEFGASLATAFGSINYNGEAQNAKTLVAVPYQTTTDTTFVKAQLDAAITLGAWRLSGFGGYNAWLRSVLSSGDVGDSNEDYRWLSLGLGASYRFRLQERLALVPELDVWGNMHIRQASQSGIDDTSHLEPGGRGAARLSLPVAWTLPGKAEFRLRPFVQAYSFTASSKVPLTQGGQPVALQGGEFAAVYQPEIRYLQYGMDAEYETRF